MNVKRVNFSKSMENVVVLKTSQIWKLHFFLHTKTKLKVEACLKFR